MLLTKSFPKENKEMSEMFFILATTVTVFIELLTAALFVRMIISFFSDGTSRFAGFVYVLTEPILIPLRSLFKAMNWFQGTPIDVSYFCTAMILSLISTVLSIFAA